MSDNFAMTIGGRAVTTAATIEVRNPATGEVFAAAPDASAAELDAAVAAATRAFPAWRDTPLADRKASLVKAAEAIETHADELAALFVREQGRPLPGAKMEILGAAMWMKATTMLDLPVDVTEDSDTRRVEVHHVPLGVVCGIVPWNFPVLLASWKIGPALMAGNTLVLKPSPFTPLCTLRIGELIRDAFPAGVINIISGGDALGPMMTAHPGFAKISFTGSTATGRRVMESAAKDLKRITLELGGNDAAIVLPDVDVDAVAAQLFEGAFHNTAQVCVATKRLYIHVDIYDALRDRLHQLAKELPVGDGAEQGNRYGPVQNEPQYRRVMALLDDARANGLTLLEGGAVPDRGYFVPLTLVDNPPEDSRVVVEEAFGPVLPLLKFTDVDDVVARANDSDYGLAGAVWSADVEAATAIAHRLDTGTVWINQNLQSTPFTPLAGAKQSGFGQENGLPGLLEFTRPKAIFIPKAA
ncbi:acyl-CoA reductase-like NAD-dependent aldehyde dehydrogenase [Sphingopyxis panaciterrae]|uniref:aldehyde dehydrogenase family protein n=1 Tax=Sphingopyxis panaciterrae TaxID=363841 RepID=UPI001423F751|nr:aldehyde dehydrogenase family protein [Sphingopyxis panaciterrae]NIJ35956.1 acyl-CoA reductase-like NAD-dependent aldehyde dehydrogenase [Sphingopyxis panaciterrae]